MFFVSENYFNTHYKWANINALFVYAGSRSGYIHASFLLAESLSVKSVKAGSKSRKWKVIKNFEIKNKKIDIKYGKRY